MKASMEHPKGVNVLSEPVKFLMLQLLECPEGMSAVKWRLPNTTNWSPASVCPKARRQFFNLLIFQAD